MGRVDDGGEWGMTMMQEAHNVRLPEYVGDLVGTVRREDSGMLHVANLLFVEFNGIILHFAFCVLRFGVGGNVKHAGLGSPAALVAHTCKPHEVPGKPCALTGLAGIFTLSVHPQLKKSKVR